jgi:hypothetical protein
LARPTPGFDVIVKSDLYDLKKQVRQVSGGFDEGPFLRRSNGWIAPFTVFIAGRTAFA